MKRVSVVPLSILLLSGLFLGLLPGCGGGGSNPPPATLTITTASLPSGQTTVSYNTMLSATGGTAPYKWSVLSGSPPSGLSLSTAGAIAGTPTTAGQASFAVQVMDSASSPQSANAKLTLAVSGGTLKIASVNAAVGTVGTAYNFQMTASGGVPPYTWAVASGSQLPAGLQMSSSGLITGAPAASGAFSPSLQVTDSTTDDQATQNVNFSINPAGPPLRDGNYVFQFGGTTAGNPVEINGAFEISGGAITIGSYNENALNQTPSLDNLFTGGSVSVPANGLGQLVLNLPSGNLTFALAAPASALKAGNYAGIIRIIEFDDTTGKGTRGSGVLRTASSATPPSKIAAGYAFGLHGFDTHSQPAAMAGSFQAKADGTIGGGEVDVNDNGTVTNYKGVTGSYTISPIGEVSATLNLSAGNTVHYSFYELSTADMLAISTDNTTSSTTPLLLGGLVLEQSGGFSNASLGGVNVLELNGSVLNNATYIPDITLGLITIPSYGTLTANYDEYKGTLVPPQSYSGTYSVDSETGRVAIVASGTPPSPAPIIYLVNGLKAFVLGTDASTSSGLLEEQFGAPFTNASFAGNYLGGTIPFPATNVVSLVAANGTGGVQYTYSASGSSGLLMNQTLSGTYTVDATGRAAVTVSGDTTPRIFYLVSPTKAVSLSGEYGGYLESFEQ